MPAASEPLNELARYTALMGYHLRKDVLGDPASDTLVHKAAHRFSVPQAAIALVGASMVYFVEHSARAVELIRANLASLGIKQGFRILQLEACLALAKLDQEEVRASIVFLDPPYKFENTYRTTLEALARSKLAARAQVIAEHEERFDPGSRFAALERTRKLEQGDTALSFYRPTAA